jgi:predicted HTH transcriptional regulator
VNLAQLLQQPEGKTLEFKRDLSSPERVMHSIIAFANTAGGSMVVGIDDGTKRVRGLVDPLKEVDRLANLVSDNIVPRLVVNIEIVSWRSKQLLIAETYPSSNRPHHFKGLGSQDGVFVRIGTSNRKADAALIRELARMVRNETFDEMPLAHLATTAIDFHIASELFKKRRRLKKSDLHTLHAVTEYHNKLVPTVGGVLLFGGNPEREFPDAWIQCGRFSGRDKSVIADSVESHGILTKITDEAFEFIRKHTLYGAVITGLKRKESTNIPLLAARELLVNAVVHADYSQQGAPIRVAIYDDRLEIDNPGLLLSGLTVADIKQGNSKLRNRVIGRVFKELRYIEQWGSGILNAIGECKKMGLPEPVFEEFAFRFRATISLVPEQEHELDEVTQQIRAALSTSATKNSGLSSQQIAVEVGLSTRAIRSRMRVLAQRGFVVAVGRNERDPLRKYFWRNTPGTLKGTRKQSTS